MQEIKNSVIVADDNNNHSDVAENFLNQDLTPSKERIPPRRMYYMWLARLFTLLAGVMLLGNVLFCLSLLQIVPKIEVDPLFLLDFSESKDISRIEHANPNISSKEIIRENFIRLYVTSVNTVVDDAGEMVRIFSPGGILFFLSAPQIYRRYNMNTKEILNFLESNQNREVKITNVQRVGRSAIWRVDFRTYEMQMTSVRPRIRYWTASVECVFRRERRLFSRLLLNPLGFTVVRYTQSEVEL